MNTIKALPKELHALEINYLKQRLAGMPAVRIKHINRGGMTLSNYTTAGVLPGIDIIYTFEDDNFCFDPELTVSQMSTLIQNRLRNAFIPEAKA